MEKLHMCRICLMQNVRMYLVINRSFHEVYEKLTYIPFVTKDRRPILACSFCCTKLKQCCQLLRKCLEAEELFAQMMNEYSEPNPLIKQDHLEFLGGFIKSPINNISIVDVVQTESIAIKEKLPAVCEELDDMIEPKEEHQSDEHSYAGSPVGATASTSGLFRSAEHRPAGPALEADVENEFNIGAEVVVAAASSPFNLRSSEIGINDKNLMKMEKLPMCRICLVQNVRMYLVVNRNFHELYEKLTDIPFVTKDRRPILVCFFCCAKLEKCSQLMRKCLEAEELFAHMMNEDYEPKLLINQDHLENLGGFIKSPIENISIVDVVQTESIAIKEELPAVCAAPDDIIEPKEEHQTDELDPENLDNICLDVADITPHHSESDLEYYVPSMEFKTKVKEEKEVSEKKRRASETKYVVIGDSGEMPEAQGLESALHPKRKRRRPPSDLDSALPPESPRPPSPLVAPPSPASIAVPSPAVFVECDGWLSAPPASPASPAPFGPPPPPRRSRQFLKDNNVAAILNYGSDSGSDESDVDDEPLDDSAMVVGIIPRVYRTTLETPLDTPVDEDADDAGDAGGQVTPATDPSPAEEVEPEPASVLPAEPTIVPPTATDQPWRWFDFEWKDFPTSSISPESRREKFSQTNVGPTTLRDEPYDCFIDIWDRPIMEYIASETNKYAQQVATQMMANNELHPTSRISRWVDTTADELYTFFGIILAMGIVVKSRIEEYWVATPDIFYTPGFSAHMSIDRFHLLNKCLHFNDNDAMGALELDGSEARLFKIQPILSHLNMKFQALYTPVQNIALDESLLMWKGWLDISQLISNKAAKKGIKSYEVCEPQTGYLWRFEIHAHKKSDQTPQRPIEDPLEASTPSIVLRLTQGLEHKGYTLWMDNFYNSPCLARRLKSLGFDCVGTLRTDRQFVPQALHSLTKRNMRQGQFAGLTSGDVDVMVWRDNNRVAMISTYHGNGQQTVRGSTKPVLILDYNIMMGGVDKKDQLLAMFPIERKRTKVWYKKLFRRLLNVSVLNSFIIYRHNHPTITNRYFRIYLIKSLLSKHCSSHSVTFTAPAATQDLSNIRRHYLKHYPRNAKRRHLRRNCSVCRQKTLLFCVGCDKSFCLENCFHQYHT